MGCWRQRITGLWWVVVARLCLAFLRLLIAWGWWVIPLGLLLGIIGRGILARAGIKAVATLLTVTLRRLIVASWILAIKNAAYHFTETLAELWQELDRVFILRLRLRRIGVALWWLLIAGRGSWLAVGLLLRLIIPLLRLREGL